MAEITTSKQYSLNIQDLGKGFLVAVFGALTTGLYQYGQAAITNGTLLQLPTMNDLKTIGFVAAFAGLSYLMKNFVTPAQTIIKQ